MKIVRSPWWACCGWRSYWCALDILTRCKFRAVCDAHDRRIIGVDR